MLTAESAAAIPMNGRSLLSTNGVGTATDRAGMRAPSANSAARPSMATANDESARGSREDRDLRGDY